MAKRISKYITLFLLLILLTISFCGCASVRAMTIENEDGSIEEQVYVSLDPNAVIEKGYNIEILKSDISSTALAESGKFITNLEQKIFQDKINATKETIQVLESFENGISVLSNNWNGNDYVISVKFKNIDVYKYYYGITESSKLETTIEENFFYNKVSFAGSTMYVKHNDLYNKLNMAFLLKYSGLIESESNELLYTYTTDLHRQHSNADYVTKLNGKYYHTWVVEDVETEEILFYYNIANTGNWILVCVGISIVACLVMFIVSFLLNKNKKTPK